jgi:hypothetical protein
VRRGPPGEIVLGPGGIAVDLESDPGGVHEVGESLRRVSPKEWLGGLSGRGLAGGTNRNDCDCSAAGSGSWPAGNLWDWQQTIGSGLCNRVHAEGRRNDRVCSYPIAAERRWFEEMGEQGIRSNDADWGMTLD